MIRSLESTPFAQIHAAFLAAFSDYSVPMQKTEEELHQMVVRRGFDPALSVGAFDSSRLVGFTLNGISEWRGSPTAYDTGTGVVPSHRRTGLSVAMFEAAEELLRRNGIRNYLLEVIQTNSPAVTLYQRLGFEITRRLSCWSYDAGSESAPDDVDLLDVDLPRWGLWQKWRDIEPSWQNSEASVDRAPAPRRLIVARTGGQEVGYLALFPATADLAQLAVAPGQRGHGIGRRLLTEAKRIVGRPVSIANIDPSHLEVMQFLERSGASRTVDQFEMIRSL